MIVVGVKKDEAMALGESFGDGRLAASAGAHEDEGVDRIECLAEGVHGGQGKAKGGAKATFCGGTLSP